MPGFTTVKRENVIVALGRDTNVEVSSGARPCREVVTVTDTTPPDRHPQGRDRGDLLPRRTGRRSTSRDVYRPDSTGARRPARHRERGRQRQRGRGRPRLHQQGLGQRHLPGGRLDHHRQHVRQPVRRQNGGTNTFFDFDTFQNVEVVTGGSLLEQQNSGVTINVVTKRGTNELKGSARFLYASGNWQSNNTPQGGDRPRDSRPTGTRFIREYGAEFGGPIVKDKLWLWAAGSRQDISVQTTRPEGLGRTRSTVRLFAVERQAELADLSAQRGSISTSTGAIVSGGRPGPRARGRDAPASGDAAQTLSFPTNFYKVEDNHVFSSSLFASVFADYQSTVLRPTFPGRWRDVQEGLLRLPTTTAVHNCWFYSPRIRRSRPTTRSRSSSTPGVSTTS